MKEIELHAHLKVLIFIIWSENVNLKNKEMFYLNKEMIFQNRLKFHLFRYKKK
jgi:hypothetical protein